MPTLAEKRWSAGVTTKWNPPAGLFAEGTAEKIASVLADESDSPRQAMSRLNFYVNRAGGNLPADRRKVLEQAKKILTRKLAEALDLEALASWVARSAVDAGKDLDPKLAEAFDAAVAGGDALGALDQAQALAERLGSAEALRFHLAEQDGVVWDLVLRSNTATELDEVGPDEWLDRHQAELAEEDLDQSAEPAEDYPGAAIAETSLAGDTYQVVRTDDAVLVFRKTIVGESVACCEDCGAAFAGHGEAVCPECNGPLEILEGIEAEAFAEAYAYLAVAHAAQEAGEQLTEQQIHRRSVAQRRVAQRAAARRGAGRYKIPLAIRRKIAKGARKAARSGAGRLRIKRLAQFNQRLAASVEFPRSRMDTFLAEARKAGIGAEQVRFECEGDTVYVFSEADLSAVMRAVNV